MTVPLVQHAKTNKSGIITADRYFRSIEQCVDGACPAHLFNAKDSDAWAQKLTEAESKLTYCSGEVTEVKAPSSGKFIATLDLVITTTKKDRDGDVLETKGARLDPRAPLLWQHMPIQPIGALVKELKRTDDLFPARFGIADTQLGRDAAVLAELGALRVSHGFDPDEDEFEPLEDDSGFLVKSFEIFEVSLVSIPSNTDAVITAFSREKLHHPAVRAWAKNAYDDRDKVWASTSLANESGKSCSCSTTKANRLARKKEFDVERQHVEAAQLEYDWISRFCSCEVKQLVNFETFAATIRMGSFLTGLKHAMADSEQVDARRLTRQGTEMPLEYETVELNSKNSDQFLVDGISFRKMKDGTCFAVKFHRQWNGEYVEVVSSEKDKGHIGGIVSKAWQWANDNNFLKGEAFSIGGEFLPNTKETWGDLFLDPSNEKEVKRTVDLLNSKGRACPNRGQVFMGPPGTGKTLSGRLIRNNADATFLWVSGKDAYYYGGINSVIMAFELAKELSPAIIFMEDIDASLDSRYAVDILKTEMDGIGRSSGVVTIVTTNHPEVFPKALLDRPGRFHDVLKFDLPDEPIRRQMIQKWMPDLSTDVMAKTAKSTDGYSGAHLYELCQYVKTLKEQDEIDSEAAITKALSKIAEQRELINDNLMADRRVASRLSESGFRSSLSLDVKNAGLPDFLHDAIESFYKVPAKYSHIDFSPPEGVQAACKNGLDRHENGETGNGIEESTVRQARKFASGGSASPDWARKGNRWWGRNERFLNEEPGTPAYASAQLWGGRGGKAWFGRMVRQMDAADEQEKGMGTTGEADGHTHTVRVDEDGNGTTGVANGHSHDVVNFRVQEADGHTHSLSRGDLKDYKGMMECPECGHKGPAGAFMPDDDEEKSVETGGEYDFLPGPIRELVCG